MQESVKGLIEQNQKAKTFIRTLAQGLPADMKKQALTFLDRLENAREDQESTETENETDNQDCAVSDFEDDL